MAAFSSSSSSLALSMAPLLALLLLLLPLLDPSSACSFPEGGCSRERCASLSSLRQPRGESFDPRIGCSLGLFNGNINGGNPSGWASVPGGPYINFGVYPQVETEFMIPSPESETVTSLPDCCALCAATPECRLYQFFESGDPLAIPNVFRAPSSEFPPGFISGQQCYLLRGGSMQAGPTGGMPYSGTHTQQIKDYVDFPPSWIGGACNSGGSHGNAQHQVTTGSDVSGTFSLVSDQRIHVNVKLAGYGAVEGLERGTRTWIKELGIVWDGLNDQRHTLILTARTGASQQRGKGFLGKVQLDGLELKAPFGSRRITGDILTLKSLKRKRVHGYEIETFSLVLEGLLDVTVTVRPALRLLQTPKEAHVHFNVNINYLQATDSVDGILGSAFRNPGQDSTRSQEGKAVARLMSGAFAALGRPDVSLFEGPLGKYETDDVLSTRTKGWATA